MIITEFYRTREDGVNLYHTYSDQNMYIEQETGATYDSAIDIENSGHTYTETDIPIIHEDFSDSQALNVIMGRDINYGLPNSEEIPPHD